MSATYEAEGVTRSLTLTLTRTRIRSLTLTLTSGTYEAERAN